MEENRQHIDKLFREELGNYTELPAPDVWASLDKKLDDHYKDGASKDRSYSWLWYVVLVILAALLFYGVKSLTGNNKVASTMQESTAVTTTGGNTSGVSSSNAGGAVPVDAEEKENDTETGEETTDKTGAKENTTADQKILNDKATAGSKNANTTAANKNNTGAQQTPNAASKNSTATNAKGKGLTKGANTTIASSKPAGSKKTKQAEDIERSTQEDKTNAASSADATTKASPGSAGNKKGGNRTDRSATDKTNSSSTASKTTKPKSSRSSSAGNANKHDDQAPGEEVVASGDKKTTTSSQDNTNKPGKRSSAKPVRQKTANSEADKTGNTNDQVASSSASPAKQKTSKGQNAAAAKTKPTANSEEANTATTAAGKPVRPAKTKPQTKNTNDDKTAANSKSADEVTKTGSFGKMAGGKNKKGTAAAKTEQNYAGSTVSDNKPLAKGAKKNTGAGSTAKTGAPKKPSGKPKDQTGISNDDEGPTQTFGDNTKQNNKPKEPKEETTPSKPDVAWQKGFEADDSRGLKPVKAGTATSDAGGNDNEPKPAPSVGKGGGGGGSGGGGIEDSKKWKDKKERKFNFSAGVKVGYEKGFGSFQANKIVLAPYFQYNFAEGVALVIQPSIKYATLNKTALADAQSYYNINSSKIDSNHTPIPAPDTFTRPRIIRRYNYSQGYDSIVASSAITKKNYYEFELPLLLQYQLSPTFAAYAGVTMNYSKIVQVTNDKKEFNGLSRTFNEEYAAVDDTARAPIKKSIESLFQHEGTPYSQYVASPSSNPTTSPFRFSYTIGINYLFGNRFLFDLMFVKMFSDPAYISDKNVKEIYKQGYLRLSLGYKFKK